MPTRLALYGAGLLSGAAALGYQVLWSRQLALVLGTSTEAVAVVLSSFMAGLGLGSALAARGLARTSPEGVLPRLPRIYARLEGTIALCALVLPPVFTQVSLVLAPLYEGPAASPLAFRLARLASSFALLAVPTTAMGATLPVLVALARPARGRYAAAAGALYAANTVGAVAGALLAPLMAFPALGLSRTGALAAAFNLIAALLVLVARPVAATSATYAPLGDAAPIEVETSRSRQGIARAALLVSFLSGLGALAHEVAWTRALALLVGPTVYVFAFVVAAVIAGLSVGSASAGRLADLLPRPALALALVQAGVVASALVLVPLIGVLPPSIGEAAQSMAGRPERLIAYEGLGTFLVLLIPSALFGASFPLAVRLLANGGVPAGAAVGRVLAWNTLGALLGPLAAAFLLLPSLGLESTLKAAAAVHVLAAWVALRAGLHRARFVAGTVGLLAGALLLLPRWDLELLAAGAYRYPPRTGGVDLRDLLRAGELLYYRDGALATVSVKRLGSARALAVDGKVDATDTADMATQRLIAHLPLLLHGAAREALVVGLGSGATVASALKHPLDSLEVVEISPEVVEAARLHFVDVLQGALDDPRLRLRVTDARNHLLLTKRRFDLIVSEPSNPWMAGVASLFTREFFSLARARLRPQGVFGQWMHAYGMPLEDLRTVVGGFADVFPESALFQVSEGDLVLVGAAGHWPTPDAAELARRMSLPAVAEDLRGVGIADPATLAALFVLGPGRLGAFAAGAPRHTDERPILELHAARAMLARTGVENRRALLEAAEGTEPPEPWRSLRAQLGPEPLVARARMLERTTGLDLALEAYGRALRLDPRSAAAQEGLVRIAAASNALPVLETLLRQLTAGPDPLGARVSLARLYREQRRTEHAARELQAVLEADPTNLRALKLLAAIQGDLGKAGAAEVLAGRAQALAPGDAEAAALLASASLLAGDAKTASERAEAALGLDPTLAMALRVKALALARLSRHDEARAAFEALVRHDGGTWQSWAHYGAFLADVGDSSGAAGAFETAADLAPDRREAWEGLRRAAVALQDRRRLTRAERALFRLNAVPTGRP